jgi:uncharacterized protein (DUF2252 family)
MTADLKDTPTAGLDAQLCGDAHPSNFGAFASPERRLLFDLNDFDETPPGPRRHPGVHRAAARRDAHDPLFLQIKEATVSALEEHLGKSTYKQHGERAVQGQRMMQAASDIYLG